MALTLRDVDKLARLSRLSLSETERNNMLVELNHVFELVEKMQEVNTDGVEPMAHPLILTTSYRLSSNSNATATRDKTTSLLVLRRPLWTKLREGSAIINYNKKTTAFKGWIQIQNSFYQSYPAHDQNHEQHELCHKNDNQHGIY